MIKTASNRWLPQCCLLLLLNLLNGAAIAADSAKVFVDPVNGEDTTTGRDGSFDLPFKTIDFALDYAELNYNSGISEALRQAYTIQLRGGEYKLLTNRNNIIASADKPVVIEAYNNELVTFDGSIEVLNPWVADSTNIYSTYIGEDIWQLFSQENGQWQEKMNARWPNARFGESKGSVTSVYQRDSWAHANETGNSNGTTIDDALANDSSINSISLNGAVLVTNSGSFDSWTRLVTSHIAGESSFSYQTTPQFRNEKHLYYFVQNKKEFLDNNDEWFFDVTTKKAYIYSDTGAPTMAMRAKNQAYAFKVARWEHVTLKNVNFFATTFQCVECENITITDSTFEYSGSARRALGKVNEKPSMLRIISRQDRASNHTLRNISMNHSDSQAFQLKGNGSIVENSSFTNIDWAATESYAPSAALVFAGNDLSFKYNTVYRAGTSETLATTGLSGGASLPGKHTGAPEGNIIAEFNHISNTGFAQSDGAMIQVRVKAQKNSVISHNWLHDSPKYGVRFDAPIPPTSYGSDGVMTHNVVYNTNGIMVKGENQRIYHNTVFDNLDSAKTELIILDDSDVNGVIGGANVGSKVINNAGDQISSERKADAAIPAWVALGHNFNGNEQGTSVASELTNPAGFDFRPKPTSTLNAGDIINDSDIPGFSSAAYSGAYNNNLTNFWYAGQRKAQAADPIPATNSKAMPVSPVLVWRPAYQASSYKVYLGSSASQLSLQATASTNVLPLSDLNADETYYWRVDAQTTTQLITGDVWQFSTKASTAGDLDGDGIVDDLDDDIDGDSVLNNNDAFPLDASESLDTDNDGIGNNADLDDDGDNVADTDDAFPLDASESVDTDNDGIGNNADLDDDGDNVADTDDAFPLDSTKSTDIQTSTPGNNAPPSEENDSGGSLSFSLFLLLFIKLCVNLNRSIKPNKVNNKH
ncbi:hypothetical protein RI844_09705 [Thalassotalea fonticola]|uniref:Right handed beta helix domain-containing protein n=1 Tax=Thalassotalea fonticola TaxID=3065649 RepID=A0ABZ0GU31_9GAMM|nr:hypothetical protein RI844_09705 [Colwelliaceae bacterium S1-1]